MSRREIREREEMEEKIQKQKEKQEKKEAKQDKKREKIEEKKKEKKIIKEEIDNEEEYIEIKKPSRSNNKSNSQNKNTKNNKNSKNTKNAKNTKNSKKKNKKGASAGKILKTVFAVFFSIFLILVIVIEGYIIRIGKLNDWELNKMAKRGVRDFAMTITGQTEQDILNLEPIYCLLVGISTDEGLELTDTIIVAAYYPRTQQASMLSIPRDTFVGKSESTAGGYDKINAVYTDHGIEGLLKKVNDITGLSISNYILVKNEGLIQLVDEIGGVEFDVPIDMNYDDGKQNLHIHLSKGLQRLNGLQAEGVLRFRHNNDWTTYSTEYGDNDLGRMRTQREFIKETLKQTIKLSNITKINDLIQIAYNNIETNVDINYVMKYTPAAIDFDVSAIESANLPGASDRFGPYNAWFFKPNKTESKEIVEKLFTSKQDLYDSGATEVAPIEPENLNIKVLNGTGSKKAFQEAIKTLEDKGYNITEKGTTTVVKTTKVINRTEKKQSVVDELIQTLGCGEATTGKDEGSYDFTIIIGRDLIK